MAPARRAKTRADYFAELEDRPVQDVDPEAEERVAVGSDASSDDEDDDGHDGREHYESVGKSTLRRRELATLGPRYEGTRVSRAGLAASDEEQSDSGAETSEGDQDSVDEEMNGTANDKSSRNTTDEEEDEGDDETDETSISDAGENNQLPEDDESADDAPAVDRSQLRQLMTDQRETVAASIAEAGKADAEKGQAVKQQRKTFDTLLNSRIRLQQGLAAVNTLSLDDFATEAFTPDVVAAAEEAALRLWRTLDTLRTSISAARTGEKRRRPALPASTPSASLWQHMQEREQADIAHRRAVLSKWSAKTQAVTTAAPAARRLAATSAAAAGLVDVLDAQLATDAPRLLKRTRTPRSCAPAQAAAGLAEADVYDDADFYAASLQKLFEE